MAGDLDLRPETLRDLFAARLLRLDVEATNKRLGISIREEYVDDEFREYSNAVIDGPAERALDVTLRLAEAAPDDDSVCWIGIVLVEPLLDLHWQLVADTFVKAAHRSAPLRMALSCASFQLRGGSRAKRKATRDSFLALIRSGEDIGRAPHRPSGADTPDGRDANDDHQSPSHHRDAADARHDLDRDDR
jgi:hypothetical protein